MSVTAFKNYESESADKVLKISAPSGHKVTSKTVTASGLALAVEAVHKDDKITGSLSYSDDLSKDCMVCGGAAVKAKIGTDSKIELNMSKSKPAGIENLSAGVTFNSSISKILENSFKLEATYALPSVHVAADVTVSNPTKVVANVATSVGTKAIALGASAKFDKSTVSDFALGLFHKGADYSVFAKSVFAKTGKLDTVTVGYLHNLNSKLSVAGNVQVAVANTNDVTFNAGASYDAVKVKVDNKGVVSFSHVAPIRPGLKLTSLFSANLAKTENTGKFGLELNFS